MNAFFGGVLAAAVLAGSLGTALAAGTAFVGDSVCLGCHSGAPMPDKSSYLMTGHRNMLRKVAPPASLTGPDGVAYAADTGGNPINWTAGTVNIAGEEKILNYGVGGWMGEGPWAPEVIHEGGSYSCARCHTTGFSMDGSGPEPILSFPGIRVNLDPDADGPAATSSWYLDGVQCERCHGKGDVHAASQDGNDIGNPTSLSATSLCVECHRQEYTVAFLPGNPAGSTISVVEPPAIEVGGEGGYAPEFFGYSTGQEFLNSPHARFTGTMGNVADGTRYQSRFKDSVGGCTACHDVHESTVGAIAHSAPIRNECGIACHSYNRISNIRHPSGPGTPLDESLGTGEKCAVCHMPRPNGGNGPSSHLFRINIDPDYRTFPNEAEFLAGQINAFTAADGNFSDAVWLDIDLACGQCHGGGTDAVSNPPRPGIAYMSRSFLASVAFNIHQTPPARFNWYRSGCDSSGYKIQVDATDNLMAGDTTTTFDWTWGDEDSSGVSTGVTTCNANQTVCTHAYQMTGSYAVTLSLNSGASVRTMIVSITPVHSVPDTGMTIDVDTTDATGMTVIMTDDSQATSCGSTNEGMAIALWGDGTVDLSTITTGAVVGSHTYRVAGTYTIRYSFKDINNNKSMSIPVTVQVPATTPTTGLFTVSGTVTFGTCVDLNRDGDCDDAADIAVGAPVFNAMIYLKKGSSIVKMGKTDSNGSFTIRDVQGGTVYTVVPVKNGLTFAPVGSGQVDIMNPSASFTASSVY